MTKKHFIELADVIRAYDVEAMRAGVFMDEGFKSGHIQALADFCARQNPRFNRERWLGYIAGECGPNGGELPGMAYCAACEHNEEVKHARTGDECARCGSAFNKGRS